MADVTATATKACQYLAVEIKSDQGKENEGANLAKMISSSPSLHTFEISFDFLPFEDIEWTMKLSELFEAGGHWPSLKQLKLRALQATDISLIKLLTTHATTLRSLELAHIGLEHYQLDGKECHGSWVETILILQSHLCLQTVRLDGNLSNGWNEAWSAVDPNKSDEPRTNDVPFEDREVTPVTDAANPVLLLLWTKVFEPVGDTLVPARELEPATEATLDECDAELAELMFVSRPGAMDDAELADLAFTFPFGAMDDAELALLVCKVKPVETSQGITESL